MTSEALAAWVQAIGSIAAIAAAFVVANSETRRIRATKRAEHIDRVARAQGVARIYGEMLLRISAQIEQCAEEKRAREVAQEFAELADLRSWGSTIDLASLTPATAEAIIAARALAATLAKNDPEETPSAIQCEFIHRQVSPTVPLILATKKRIDESTKAALERARQ